jgi:hypothetical protein
LLQGRWSIRTSTISMRALRTGDTGMKLFAMVGASMRETTMAMAFTKSTSIRWRDSGHYCVPGSGRIAAFHRKSCLFIWDFLNSSTTLENEERRFCQYTSDREETKETVERNVCHSGGAYCKFIRRAVQVSARFPLRCFAVLHRILRVRVTQRRE